MPTYLISKALDCLGYGIARVLGLEYDPILKPAKPPPLPSRLSLGDWVMLRKENPYKGILRVGKAYRVLGSAGGYLVLSTSDEPKGYFEENFFEKLGYDPDPPGAKEYDEIIEAQDFMQ